MKKLLSLVALALALTLLAGALAEGLVLEDAYEAAVPEVEFDLAANDGDDEDEPEGIPIDAAHFPDETFRAYLYNTYDMDKNGLLDEDEIDYADAVEVGGSAVTSLQGIEYLTSLEHLSCENCNLVGLDVTKNTELVFLNCRYCGLTSLNLSGLTELEALFCENNQLAALDASGCEALELLGCGENPMTSLKVARCESLMSLDCAGTQITALDLSSCESLITVCVNGCAKLASVKLKGAEDLVSFGAMLTALTELDISGNDELQQLFTIGSPIKRIDLSKNESLLKAVTGNAPECDGTNVSFGKEFAVRTEVGELVSKPVNVYGTTVLTNGSKVLYQPEFSLEQTGTVTLVKGKTLRLNTVFNPEGLEFFGPVTWKTSSAKIATVDAKGVVKAVAKGTATITATTAWGATAEVKVQVTPPLPKKVKLNKKGTLKLKEKQTFQLTATLTPAGSESKLTWKSSNTKVATVSNKGLVKAKGVGTATITVTTENGKTAKVKVKVTKK